MWWRDTIGIDTGRYGAYRDSTMTSRYPLESLGDVPSVVELMHRAVTSPEYKRTEAEIAADNKRAEKLAYDRFAHEVAQAVKQFGVWNALALIPDVLRDHGANTTEHYSEAECDFMFAAEIVEAAIVAVDLKYRDGSSQADRRRQLEAMLTMMKGVRT